MEKSCSLLIFNVTSSGANSSSLLQALAFCKRTLLDRVFEIGEGGLLSVYPPATCIHYRTAHIDLGHNQAENAHRLAVMSRLWEKRELLVYENSSVAPIVHIDNLPHELLTVKKYPFVPWFCPVFKIIL